MKAACGTVFKYGDNVDTDIIIPARYVNSSDPKELAGHCMEDIDKAAGISCVIAETFARIFYRNAINIGLPIVECKEAATEIEAGDEVEVDFDTGIITDKTKGTKYQGQAFPEFMQKIIDSEGLVNYINQK